MQFVSERIRVGASAESGARSGFAESRRNYHPAVQTRGFRRRNCLAGSPAWVMRLSRCRTWNARERRRPPRSLQNRERESPPPSLKAVLAFVVVIMAPVCQNTSKHNLDHGGSPRWIPVTPRVLHPPARLSGFRYTSRTEASSASLPSHPTATLFFATNSESEDPPSDGP